MADTRVQLEVEDWIREHWMPENLGQPFYRKRLKLSGGGVFDFDAASSDSQVVACISTSAGKTLGGNIPSGKLMKIRSDILFLTMVQATRRIIILVDQSMMLLCEKERAGGRVPPGIEFLHALIPAELQIRLKRAQESAGREVTPQMPLN